MKLLWLLENESEVARAAAEYNCCFGTIDTWLIYNLTGMYVEIGNRWIGHLVYQTRPQKTTIVSYHVVILE